MKIINDLNFKKQARDLGVSVWQTPGFLLTVMGVITLTVMTITYYISRNNDNPGALFFSESLIAIIILVIGNSIIRLVEQMARLNKMKGEFVSVASHQLRTPLSAIRWETELLLSKFRRGLNAKQLKNIEDISVLSGKMAKLVNDLLDVARIDQNRLVLKKDPLDLKKICEEVIGEIMPLTRSRNIELIFSCNKKVPKIIGDRERLKMVIENLINNSIKYTVNRGKIEIKIVKKENFLTFSVKDNGVGIPEEQHNRVFDKFFRSDNSVKYQTEGTGLGLYIARNIIEQLGGKIWFQSVENLGSIFNFSIPIKS